MNHKIQSENNYTIPESSSSRWFVIAVAFIIFLLITISIFGYFDIKRQFSEARDAVKKEISAVADLKVSQIESWYKANLLDAEVISNNPIVREKALQLLSGSKNAGLKKELLEWMKNRQKYHEYIQMVLFDSKGMPLLSVPADLAAFDEAHNKYFQAALLSENILPIDLHRDHDVWNYIHLSIYIPVGIKQGADSTAKGAWMIQIDPYQLLYPLIQTWPSARYSAETLLVRREGNDILFLNELRHRKNTALELRIPIDPKRRLPAAMAVIGQKGVIDGIDYRNVPVLADLRSIPGTNWFMVAKIDRKEVYAAVRKGAWKNGAILLTLLLASLSGIGFVLKQRNNQLLKQRLVSEQVRRSAAEALNESRRETGFFAGLLEKSSQPFAAGYPDGRIKFCNAAFAKLVGYSKEELKNINWASDLTPPEWLGVQLEKMKGLSNTNRSLRYEKEYIRKDGSRVPIEVYINFIKDEKETPGYYYAFINDTTERKLADKALRESEERLKLALMAANQGIYDLNIETGEAETSPEYATMLGYDPADFVETNTKWIERLHPDDRERVSGTYKAYIHGNLPVYQVEFRQHIKSGDWKWILSLGKIIEYSAEGRPLRMLGTHTDITDRKLAEERMLADSNEIRLLLEEAEKSRRVLLSVIEDQKQAQKQIQKLNAELEQRVQERTARFEAANRELEAFSYSVSHDLRSPLQHITGFAELLYKHAAGSLDEKNMHYLKIIRESTVRMGTLIDDLLSFSRMGRSEMMKKNISLDAIVREVINDIKMEIKERNIEWKICPLPEVSGDPAMLKLVYVNLISNALKFTKEQSKADIEIGSMSGDKDEICLYVKDNGAGFDMKYVDKLFGLFQRLHRAEEFGGTGLGLANIRRIINRHGGKTWAEGSVNEGATFYFTLPER